MKSDFQSPEDNDPRSSDVAIRTVHPKIFPVVDSLRIENSFGALYETDEGLFSLSIISDAQNE